MVIDVTVPCAPPESALPLDFASASVSYQNTR
jgi:hypothetical protein